MIINIEKEEVNHNDLDKAVDVFAKLKNRQISAYL